MTGHRSTRQRLARVAILVRSLVAGRIYYADGTSERSSRSWVWKALGPHVDTWPMHHPWLGEHDECGCVRWRVIHRPAIWCMDHPDDDSLAAWLRDEATTTAIVYPTNTATNSTAVFVFPDTEDHS